MRLVDHLAAERERAGAGVGDKRGDNRLGPLALLGAG